MAAIQQKTVGILKISFCASAGDTLGEIGGLAGICEAYEAIFKTPSCAPLLVHRPW